MFKFTRAGIIYVLTAILFIMFQIFIRQNKIQEVKTENIMQKFVEIENTNIEQIQLPETTREENEIWKIEIPTISLNAEIVEGTTNEILNQYVGHFENTKKENGNIGLAAHNRGYKVNYFQKLKLLKKGDEIKYKHNKFEKIYEVEKCRIIKDTDWEYLDDTEENRLTLITCVENQPEYRRCIQAIEKQEEIY